MSCASFNAWCVTVEHGIEAKVAPFRHDDLKGLQEFVGGHVEAFEIKRMVGGWDGLLMLVNESPNRTKLLPLQTPWHHQPIYGNFLICRHSRVQSARGRFASVTKADIKKLNATPIGMLSKVHFETHRQIRVVEMAGSVIKIVDPSGGSIHLTRDEAQLLMYRLRGIP